MGLSLNKQPACKISIDQAAFFRVKQKLCLDDANIQDLYQFFRKFDKFDKSFIDFDDFIAYFRSEIQNFVELPYAERLFSCIPKSQSTKIFFEQFIEGISAFCLLNNESLLHFIFDFIDTDGDERISKKDIMKLVTYTDPLNGRQTFFTNFGADLEQFPMKQKQVKMDFDHFRMNSDRLMFLIWPAFSLQQYLRQNTFGSNFWSTLYKQVQKKENQIKNNEKKEQRVRQKLQILKNIKTKKVQQLTFKDKVNARKSGQTADDSKLLKRISKPRRRSALYIKQQIQMTNAEQNMIEQ